MPIRKRNGRYQVRVGLGGQRRIERTLPAGATRTDAQALEARLLRERVDTATGRAAPRHLISDALDRWEQTEASRLKSYHRDLRYRIGVVRTWIAGRALDDIPEVAEKIKAQGAQAGMSAAGINRTLSILRRIGNLAVRWGWTDKPLGQRVSMVPGEAVREVYLTRDQVRAVLAEIREAEVRDFVLFAALTGMRRGEILSLRPEQVQGSAVVLTSATKSGRPRYVPMPRQAARIAAKRLPWTVTARHITTVWERARKAAGMPGLRLHDIRHSFATWLASSGTPMTVIRDILGHSSLAVTSRYSHAARPDLHAAVAKLRV